MVIRFLLRRINTCFTKYFDICGFQTQILVAYAGGRFVNFWGLVTASIEWDSRVGKGISAQASHRTVREVLTSYGSYHIIKHA